MAEFSEESVLFERSDSIATLTIHRPESLNALNQDVLTSLLLAFDTIDRDVTIRAVIIRGHGDKAFVAGADVRTMSNLGPRAIADYLELGQRATRVIECSRVPVIAAVNGYALGGGLELALSCDLIIAADSAQLGQPEVNLGIIPGFGGTQRLIQRCGVGAARYLSYTGELITASEGKQIGLVDRVIPGVELMECVTKLAHTIARKAPLAVEAAKKIMRESQQTMLLSGLRLEAEEFLRLFQTKDREEGMQAFLEKRPANFTRH